METLYGSTETAALIGRHPVTVRNYALKAKRGEPTPLTPVQWVARRPLFTKAAIEKFIAENPPEHKRGPKPKTVTS